MVRIKLIWFFNPCKLIREGSEEVRLPRFISKAHKIMSWTAWSHKLWINPKNNCLLGCCQMNNEINQIAAPANYEDLSQFHIFIKKCIWKSNDSLATKLTLGCHKDDE
jgi:hypothetical protein